MPGVIPIGIVPQNIINYQYHIYDRLKLFVSIFDQKSRLVDCLFGGKKI